MNGLKCTVENILMSLNALLKSHEIKLYELVFGSVLERRESKCRAVLMKYLRKVKSEQVITLQVAQQLKAKNINVGQLSCRMTWLGCTRQCKKN